MGTIRLSVRFSAGSKGFLLTLCFRLGVQAAMEEMERMEQKGNATPEEIEALAQEVSTKMLLTTWKATRFEVINVSWRRASFTLHILVLIRCVFV